ncbi:MAG: 2-amino-4-hydroxy-6-hydroxymethyldihydropteridine diphosphokinase [Planctomycetaceae bacterium]|jgi:2-amino-4-hydroxy-6-hydroxymethyldihydropteridine diphosphokinase|nr:2-amino-4-hydroxy-6-hydroxymethyldihydropteridine diphosphokinase [Planctomycetaceae bacterium]
MFRVLLGLGANLGDREKNLTAAWSLLGTHEGIRLIRLSSFYRTEPVGGPPGQPEYLNAAGLIETNIEPMELLGIMLEIEVRLGRVRTVPHGPRTIDLDLLLYGQKVMQNDTLSLPHPYLHERLFVLKPAAEIASEMIHPVFQTAIQSLLTNLLHSKIKSKNSKKQKNSF